MPAVKMVRLILLVSGLLPAIAAPAGQASYRAILHHQNILEHQAILQHRDTLLIHFDPSRSRLRPDAMRAIDSALSRHGPSAPLVRIDLSGHCDRIGSDDYNEWLSGRRVGSARNYLRSRGVPDSLFGSIKRFGKRRPLNDNGDERKRSLNRRVGIVLYSLPVSSAIDHPSTIDHPSPIDHPSTIDHPSAINSPSGIDHSLTPSWSSGTPLLPPATVPSPQPLPSLTLLEFFRDSAQAGKTYILRNLNFVIGRHVLQPYSDTVLKDLLRIMLDSPRLKIEIRGHVCCIAPALDGLDIDTRTEDLSVRRARFVYDYLRQRGVKASRMSYHGFGASQKLYPEERDDREQELNRRVEIKRKNPQD